MENKFQIPSVLILGIIVLQATQATYIIHMLKSEMPAEFEHHMLWYSTLLKSVSDSADMLYSYDQVIDGFAASLTEEEAKGMAAQPGVLSLQPDSRFKLHTTRTPKFLGLDKLERNHNQILLDAQQQNVVIGVFDTGIWPESQSFDDTGYGPIPRFWRGKCEIGAHFNESMCNKKLIGARYFLKGYEQAFNHSINWTKESKSARDDDGHGTHTSSTVVGSAVDNANVLGYANGTARGMVSKARIAMYKVCWNGGCFDSDILKAIDTAISDGVHVLSLSLGGIPSPFYRDIMAIGTFTAAVNGIFVSCSSGNDGPSTSSVTNIAPWIATVGAGTIDRDFPASLTLSNGKTYAGTSLYSGHRLPRPLPIVYAGLVSKNKSTFCLSNTLIPESVKGKIVLCDRGVNARVEKGAVVKEAGGSGMVLANTGVQGEELVADSHILPALAVGQKVGDKLRKYLSSPKLKATFEFGGTKLGVKPSPVVAAFSSRGPSAIIPEVLKPDLIAPGVNILAAWSQAVSPTGLEIDNRRVNFNIISGTSMSCPHVSGLAALLKAAHPEWSPAAIRSALMTTAYTSDMCGNPMIDAATGNTSTPFDHGAGHVDPIPALDPGLIYNLTTQDYLNFLCAINYTAQQIKILTRRNFACDPKKVYSTTTLNYPSFSVQAPANIASTRVVTHKRAVTNVGLSGSTYKAFISSPSESVKISVVPEQLTFQKRNDVRPYTVTFKMKGPMPRKTYQFGEIKWSDGKHVVRSPIVCSWI